MKSFALFIIACLFVCPLLGCGGGEAAKTVDELNTTLDSVYQEVNSIKDVASAKQALENLKQYEGREADLTAKFKRMMDDDGMSAAAMLKLRQTQTTVENLQKKLKELSKDPKLRRHLKPVMDKYMNRDLPFKSNK